MPKPSSTPPPKSSRKTDRRAAASPSTQSDSPSTQSSLSLTPPSERTRSKPHYDLEKLIDIDVRDGEVKFLVKWRDDDGEMIESWNLTRHHTFSDKGNRGTLRTLIEGILRANPRRVFAKEVCDYLSRSEAKDYEKIRAHIIAERRPAAEQTVRHSDDEEDEDDDEEEEDEGEPKKPTGRELLKLKPKKKLTEVEERLARMRSSSAGNKKYFDMIYDRPSRGPAPRTSHQDRRPNRRRPTSASPAGRSGKSVTKTHSKKTDAPAKIPKNVPVGKTSSSTTRAKTPVKEKTIKTPVKKDAAKTQSTAKKTPAKKPLEKKQHQKKGALDAKSGKSGSKNKK